MKKKPLPRLTLRNTADVAMHGHPPGSEFVVKADAAGAPLEIVYRKRLVDGTFAVVTEAPKAKPAKEAKA